MSAARTIDGNARLYAIANRLVLVAVAAAFAASAALAQKDPAPVAGARKLKLQSARPASAALQENFRFFAERVDKLTSGQLKIEAIATGRTMPAVQILDAAAKGAIDGAHGFAYDGAGRNKAAALFSSAPAGHFGMDQIDFMGWLHEGGGLAMWWDYYQNTLKRNVIAFPILPSGAQAFGWFKRPIRNLADLKDMKCRQTGMVAEIFQRMGVTTVEMPGNEIVSAVQRGAIDCAGWTGSIEDLRLGLSKLLNYHYTPGMHESSAAGELIINRDVWNSLPEQNRDAIRSAATETFVRWWAKSEKQNADALEEMRGKHGMQILRTPPDILIAYLKAWDEIAKEASAKDPVFRKILDSQREYASIVVPAKRLMFPPYSLAANYYWPDAARTASRPAGQ